MRAAEMKQEERRRQRRRQSTIRTLDRELQKARFALDMANARAEELKREAETERAKEAWGDLAWELWRMQSWVQGAMTFLTRTTERPAIEDVVAEIETAEKEIPVAPPMRDEQKVVSMFKPEVPDSLFASDVLAWFAQGIEGWSRPFIHTPAAKHYASRQAAALSLRRVATELRRA